MGSRERRVGRSKRRFGGLYLAGLLVQVLIRFPYARQYRRTPKLERRGARSEPLLLAGLTVGGLVLPVVDVATPWLDRADYGWSVRTRQAAGTAGVALLAAAQARRRLRVGRPLPARTRSDAVRPEALDGPFTPAVQTPVVVTLMPLAEASHETAIGRVHQIAADLRRADQNAGSSWLRAEVGSRSAG